MPTFLAIGHHGPVEVDNAKQMAEDAVEWIVPRLTDATFDRVYTMAGGGRLVIADAESEDTRLSPHALRRGDGAQE